MGDDVPSREQDLVRRLAGLDIRSAAFAAPGAREAPPADAGLSREVAAALEEIRQAVGVLAEIQGRLYALRRLKERAGRVRPGRTPDR